ncbi:Acetyltransferase (GNAT) domain-containing protein [Rathayibacter oskolensis]|uniref:Acetyltransferase (GNAT) domain-containing protein n=1 Tax=Rathayibacter oskolensis TaxID=1891671 RepID=A0A1X7NXK0_9MICO|nr:GNAT family N-acetyltransferase [Rathayibacter oskolensis]SMH42660.1 Acetyltransferase (GNAT) domain-containing protein [Rathayibacter oskolensis]
MPDEPHLIETTAADPEALALFASQEAEVMRRYGGDDPGPRPHPGAPTLLLRLGDAAVGCVALSADGSLGEIKRMFVAESARGRGLSRLLLGGVEELARRRGVETLRLVTGTEQPEAMALYSSSGYLPIPGFGYWGDEPATRCFAKRLAPAVIGEHAE